MQRRSVRLDTLRVADPCTEEWGAMRGGERRRFCAKCNKHVHNLSRMTTSEAEKLLASSSEAGQRVCVLYRVAADGGPETLDYAPPRRPRFGARLWIPLAVLVSAAGAIVQAFMPGKVVAPALPPPGALVVGGVGAPPLPMGVATIMGDVGPESAATPTEVVASAKEDGRRD